jgi:hypothetical protein
VTAIRFHKEGKFAVLESPPACRSLSVTEYARSNVGSYDERVAAITSRHYLSFPWVVYGITYAYSDHNKNRGSLQTIHVGFRNKELSARDQTLYYPQLFNVYSQTGNELYVCLGSYGGITGKLSDDEFFLKVIAEFWSSTFVCSGSVHTQYKNTKSYADDPRLGLPNGDGPAWKLWAENTKKNPGFILKVDWKPAVELSDMVKQRTLAYPG